MWYISEKIPTLVSSLQMANILSVSFTLQVATGNKINLGQMDMKRSENAFKVFEQFMDEKN